MVEGRLARIVGMAKSYFRVSASWVSSGNALQQNVVCQTGAVMRGDVSFCSYVVGQSGAVVVADAALDPRFALDPLVVGPPHIRFFAGIPLRFPDGDLWGTLCIMDANAREMTDEELAVLRDLADLAEGVEIRSRLTETELQLQAIIDNIADGIVAVDACGQIIFVNSGMVKMFGYPDGELVGQNIKMLMPESERGSHDGYLATSQPGKPTFILGHQRDLMGTGKDGNSFPIEISVSELPLMKQCRFIGVIRDISERKRRQREVEFSRLLLNRIVDSSPSCMIVLDDGHRVTHWNRACEAILGVSAAEVVGAHNQWKAFYPMPRAILADLVMEDNAAERIARRYGDIVHQSDNGWEGVDYFPDLPGGGRWMHFMAAPMRDEMGRIIGAVETLIDVTAQKNREQELEESKVAAMAASHAKSQFLATMSHEIKTPMNAVVGLTSQLRRGHNRDEDAPMIDSIIQASNHLVSIVNHILDLSQAEAGQLEVGAVVFDLSGLIVDAFAAFSERAESKGIRLRIKVDDAVPTVAVGDVVRLHQCLQSYLDNAVKFTERGEITLRVTAADRPSGWMVRFEVEDTGVGIAPDAQEKIFTAFEQADGSASRKYGGVGIGVAMTRNLARLMGGDAGFASELGKGSRFWFDVHLLPDDRSGVQLDADEVERRLREHHRQDRILLVEDNPTNRSVVLGMLSDVGMTAQIAEHGQQAVDMVREQTFDLILMDLQMPVMDGITAARRIRELPDNTAVPIVAMTANSFAQDKLDCLRAGMNDHFAKPILPEVFYAALLKWLPVRAGADVPAAAEAEVAVENVKLDDEGLLRTYLGGNPWVDIDVGLKFNRRADRYVKVLLAYAESHAATISGIRASMSAGDPVEARRIAHSLKGGSGMLGIVGVQEPAAQLEQAILDGQALDGFEPLLQVTDQRLSQVLSAIQSMASQP